MTIKKLIGMLTICLLACQLAFAEVVEVPVKARPDSPQQYVVQPGDSLWKIAGIFLQDPWRWPGIWQNNAQIENPHLIYPGDIIVLVQTAGGLRLVVNPTDSRLSPAIISEPIGRPIPLIPLHEIAQFLDRSTAVDSGNQSDYPYVLSGVGEHVVSGAGDQVYARKLPDGVDFEIFRLGKPYIDPVTDENLGHAALYIGSASVVQSGDPAILLITQSQRETLAGDIILPPNKDLVEPNFHPHPADASLKADIIDVVDGVSQIGQYQVVVIDRGTANGVQVGHALRVFKSPADVYDSTAAEWVSLPDERAGTLLVFKVFERVSFGLVMSASMAIELGDKANGGAG